MNRETEELIDLVSRARSGNVEAFETLYNKHQAGIYTFIKSQVRDGELAADLMQQTFVRAWEGLSRLRAAGAFRSWLHTIASNLIRDEAKSGRARLERTWSELEEDDRAAPGPISSAQPGEMVEEAELRQVIRAALNELPAEQQAVVIMHHLEGMSVNEIAKAQGVRPGTVMSRLARAREALRVRLSGYVEASK